MSVEMLERPTVVISETDITPETLVPKPTRFSPRPRRWTVGEFELLIEQGIFENQRVELIEGEILEMSPMLEPHSLALMLVQDECYRVFASEGLGIRTQMPFFVGEGYRPEPDIAIVSRANLSLHAPPSVALLIVEVSDSTLSFDRDQKSSLYAKAGVADYWILNLPDRCLEVRRDPRIDAAAKFGYSYASLQTLKIGQSVSPLASPNAVIPVDSLLSQTG